jgi:hypothetical protein
VDPYALPCHPDLRVDSTDRDWRAVGVKTTDGVRRKTTRCPACKTSWTAFERVFGDGSTVEWVTSVPFRVTAVPAGGVLWQDLDTAPGSTDDQQAPAPTAWADAVQQVSVVRTVTAGGAVFAEPGDVLLERRERWNPQDRRLALL